MSQHPQPAIAAYPHPQYVMVPMRESNGLGVAGFFIALIGLFIPTGIIALLGMLISLVALGKAPRGFAGMGVVIGLFGTVLWLAITGVAILGAAAVGIAIAACGAVMFAFTQPEIIELTSEMLNVTFAAVEYEDEHGGLPDGIEVLALSESTRLDPWGTPYRLVLVEDDDGFDVTSAGPDKLMGTDDDLALSRMDDVWRSAFESFGQKMEEFGQRMERLDGRNIKIGRGANASNFEWTFPACGSKRALVAEADAVVTPEPESVQ